MQFYGFCDYCSRNTSFVKIEKKEKQHMGIVVRPTSIVKYFTSGKGHVPFKKDKTLDLLEIVVVLH
jgi:hypothetical protein